MSHPIRLGIVGLGYMGRLHLQKASESPEAEVVALFDTNPDRQAQLASEGWPVVSTYEALVERCEAVIIASPTVSHAEYAMEALRAHRHILIEKPVTVTPEELQSLIRLREEVNVVTVVGHVERFNPAFQALWPYRDRLEQYSFERIAPWTPRGSDASVVLDLLIHDLDLFWALTEGRIANIRATAYRSQTGQADTVQVWIDLVDGRGASFLASRIAPHKRRRIIAHSPHLWIEADLLSRSVLGWQLQAGETPPLPFSQTTLTDALAAELEHFLSCIRHKSTSFLSLEHVQPVMAWAWQVEALAEHRLAFSA